MKIIILFSGSSATGDGGGGSRFTVRRGGRREAPL